MLALGICFPQTCSSADRRFAAAGSRLHYYRQCFVSTKTNPMKYIENWIPLRLQVRSRNTQPHLNEYTSQDLLQCAGHVFYRDYVKQRVVY